MLTKPDRQQHSLAPLDGWRVAPTDSYAQPYANRLLASLGASVTGSAPDPIAAQTAWAASGAMALTGCADGAPLACPAPLAASLQGCCDALQAISGQPLVADGAALLGERAALSDYHRQGSVSAGGSCRLLAAAAGHVAINLARDDDWSLLPALLCSSDISDWEKLAVELQSQQVASLCERARMLGLALSDAGGEACHRNWYEIIASGPKAGSTRAAPLVIDLSSLWAGPLCGQLLQLAGARVIKVESTSRPDGARFGPAAFFDLLNGHKQSVALDLRQPRGIARLQALLSQADIVIESSRPRALQQMGIFAEQLVAAQQGLTWISISGYGRDPDQGLRVAYGDDVGVAAGLSALLQRQYGKAVFCADAIADPLSGAYAALAALAGWHSGGGYLFDISMHAVLSDCLQTTELPCGTVRQRHGNWFLNLNRHSIPVRPPRARPIIKRAAALGSDTASVCREFAHHADH